MYRNKLPLKHFGFDVKPIEQSDKLEPGKALFFVTTAMNLQCSVFYFYFFLGARPPARVERQGCTRTPEIKSLPLVRKTQASHELVGVD